MTIRKVNWFKLGIFIETSLWYDEFSLMFYLFNDGYCITLGNYSKHQITI